MVVCGYFLLQYFYSLIVLSLFFFILRHSCRGGGEAGVGFIAIVEVGEEFIVFLLCELIILVTMTAAADGGEAEPDGSKCFHAIHD